MLYIDPKDQPAHPDWNATYAAAWNERKRLRLEHFRLGKAVEEMDQFLAMYEKLEPQKPDPSPQVTVTTTQQSGCCNTAQDGRPPAGEKHDG
jgi:hypothetical protein